MGNGGLDVYHERGQAKTSISVYDGEIENKGGVMISRKKHNDIREHSLEWHGKINKRGRSIRGAKDKRKKILLRGEETKLKKKQGMSRNFDTSAGAAVSMPTTHTTNSGGPKNINQQTPNKNTLQKNSG